MPGAKIDRKSLQIVQICAMVIGMLAMGLAVDLRTMVKILKRPWGVLIGLICQFLIMPMVGFAAVKTGLFGPYEVLIIMLYGTCPGGGVSNFFAYFLRLNIDLSGKIHFEDTIPEELNFYNHIFSKSYHDQRLGTAIIWLYPTLVTAGPESCY